MTWILQKHNNTTTESWCSVFLQHKILQLYTRKENVSHTLYMTHIALNQTPVRSSSRKLEAWGRHTHLCLRLSLTHTLVLRLSHTHRVLSAVRGCCFRPRRLLCGRTDRRTDVDHLWSSAARGGGGAPGRGVASLRPLLRGWTAGEGRGKSPGCQSWPCAPSTRGGEEDSERWRDRYS